MVTGKTTAVFFGIAVLLFVSCNSFLDVQPKNQFVEMRVFSDSATIHLARQGIYNKLASNDLYGGTLTMGALDVMAHYYTLTPDHSLAGWAHHNYTDRRTQETIYQVWRQTYSAILNINTFIRGLKEAESVISPASRALLLGESYGLRAYLHFDLLRLFGPLYPERPEGRSIPYNIASTPLAQSFLTARQAMKRVIEDLDTARTYLANDPVRKGTVHPADKQRFNFHTALATLARVHLYAGNRELAATYAQGLLDEENDTYPWGTDRLFSDEVIFHLPVVEMPQQYERYFYLNQVPSMALVPSHETLMDVYLGNVMDLRYRLNWDYVPRSGERSYHFLKYSPPADFVPLLRKTELYLILAECAEDEAEASRLLQEIAFHREGVLPTQLSRDEVLQYTYRQEFWGEGQLFYFYKRLAKAAIPSPNGTQDWPMFQSAYVLPIPAREFLTQ